MAANKMKFSSYGANAIQNEFARAADPIKETLNSVMKTVETLREWWVGDSADEFVNVSYDLKKKVEAELVNWLEANKQLIKDIEGIKFDGERRLAGSIRGLAQ